MGVTLSAAPMYSQPRFDMLGNLPLGVGLDGPCESPLGSDLPRANPVYEDERGCYSIEDFRMSPFGSTFDCMDDAQMCRALGRMRCYALRCNPVDSMILAFRHFQRLDKLEEIADMTAIGAAAEGKQVRASTGPVESFWQLTSWGRQYLELEARAGDVIYGGRFTAARGW